MALAPSYEYCTFHTFRIATSRYAVSRYILSGKLLHLFSEARLRCYVFAATKFAHELCDRSSSIVAGARSRDHPMKPKTWLRVSGTASQYISCFVLFVLRELFVTYRLYSNGCWRRRRWSCRSSYIVLPIEYESLLHDRIAPELSTRDSFPSK